MAGRAHAEDGPKKRGLRLHRSIDLDRLREERAAGAKDAAVAIEATLRAQFNETGDLALLHAIGVVQTWAAKGTQGAVDATAGLVGSRGRKPGSVDLSGPDDPPG